MTVTTSRAIVGLPDVSGGFDSDSARGLVGLLTTGDAPPPPPDPIPDPPSSPTGRAAASAETAALMLLAGGERAESVYFELVDLYGATVGELTPIRDVPATVTNDPSRTIPRTLDGLYILWSEAKDVDTGSQRVKPWWVFENGEKFPLGVFSFGHAPRLVHGLGSDIFCSLVDESIDLDQVDGGIVAYATGASVADCLRAEWTSAGVRSWTVEPSSAVLGGPLTWSSGSTRRDRMHDLSVLASFLDPYFDNLGRGVSRAAPDLELIEPDFRYGPRDDEYPIIRGSITEDDDRLSAPNRYIAIGTSASDNPIVGIYDIPAWVPWSSARSPRGIVCAQPIRVQGIETPAQAEIIAKAAATSDPSLNRTVTFQSPPVPLHDTWDTIGYNGEAWLEQGWTLALTAGGPHTHAGRRSLVP